MRGGYQVICVSRRCFCGSAAFSLNYTPYPRSGRKMLNIPPRAKLYKEAREKGMRQILLAMTRRSAPMRRFSIPPS